MPHPANIARFHAPLTALALDKQVQIFRWDGKTLRESAPPIKVMGGAAAIATAGQ